MKTHTHTSICLSTEHSLWTLASQSFKNLDSSTRGPLRALGVLGRRTLQGIQEHIIRRDAPTKRNLFEWDWFENNAEMHTLTKDILTKDNWFEMCFSDLRGHSYKGHSYEGHSNEGHSYEAHFLFF